MVGYSSDSGGVNGCSSVNSGSDGGNDSSGDGCRSDSGGGWCVMQ